jgi:hypothetical protein
MMATTIISSTIVKPLYLRVRIIILGYLFYRQPRNQENSVLAGVVYQRLFAIPGASIRRVP